MNSKKRITPEQFKNARKAAGLTQSEAAVLLSTTPRTVQHWEGGTRNCPFNQFELFLLKTGQLQTK